MGLGANIRALLVGLAAFAGWTLSRFTVPRRVGWANGLGGLNILALFFSVASPDDDEFQQELIRPATPRAKLSARTKLHRREEQTEFRSRQRAYLTSINVSASRRTKWQL